MQQHPASAEGENMETMGKILHFRSRIEQQQEANAMKETDYVKACTGNGKANDEKGRRFLDSMTPPPTPQGQRAGHTPTPYEYPTDCGCIFGDGREIALVHGENRDANAAFICRAANSYDEMLKALCGIVAEYPDPKLPYGKRIVEIARYAIKSATKET